MLPKYTQLDLTFGRATQPHSEIRETVLGWNVDNCFDNPLYSSFGRLEKRNHSVKRWRSAFHEEVGPKVNGCVGWTAVSEDAMSIVLAQSYI
jgi:hypothetical protein